MMARPVALSDAVLACSLLLGGIVAGLVLDRLLRRRLRRRGTITSWGGDHVVLAALRTAILVWFAAAGIASAAAALPLRPHVAHVIGKVIAALVVGSTTLAIARAVADSVKMYSLRTAGAVRSSSIFVTLSRVAVLALGLLVLLQALGLSITPVLTALGVGGLAVALALQDTLANLFAGIHILASRKVRLGDYVKLDSGEEGFVIDISWRNTSIRQLSNSVVIVPNSKLASALVTNFYQPERETAVLVNLGVDYASDLDHVEEVTLDVARSVLRDVPGGVSGFTPVLRYNAFGEYAIEFTVVLRAQETTDRYVLTHEFIKRAIDRYRGEGIVIPYPARTIHITDGHAERRSFAGAFRGQA